jgi:hypothetical protein
MLSLWAGPLMLAVVWLGVLLYLGRFSLWMIAGGIGFCILLIVLAMVLNSAAGPAASWQGTTSADRAGGRGFEADAGFLLFINGVGALVCCAALTLITVFGVGIQASLRKR